MAKNRYNYLLYGAKKKEEEEEKEEISELERVSKEVSNLQTRLGSIGEEPKTQKKGTLLTILENLGRTGYGSMNMLREVTRKDNDIYDPLQAFKRGFMLQEKSTGKDLLGDLNVSSKPWTKFKVGNVEIAPNTAGLLGFGLDVLNPLDLLNWVTFGAGGLGAKTAMKGEKLLTKAFGNDVSGELIEKLGRDWVDTVSKPTVGELVGHLGRRADKMGIQQGINTQTISDLMLQGLKNTGLKPGSRIQEMPRKALTVNLQAPFTNKHLSTLNLPGSSTLLQGLSRAGHSFKNSPVGQTMGQAFSTKFSPNTVPAGVWTRMIRAGQKAEPMEHQELETLLKNLRQGSGIDNLPPTAFPENIIKQAPENVVNNLNPEERIGLLKASYPGIFDNIDEKNVVTHLDNLRSAVEHLKEKIKNFRVGQFDELDRAYLKSDYTPEILNDPVKLRETVIGDLENMAKELEKRADILDTYIDPKFKPQPDIELDIKGGEESMKEVRKKLARMEELSRIREQSFEKYVAQLFKGTSTQDRKDILQAAIHPDKAAELKTELQPILDEFVRWREQVVEDYRKLGVTFTPLENYVPFVGTGKPLTKDEMATLRGLFGNSVKQVNTDDFLDMIYGADPFLKPRDLKAVDPAEINKVLGREWLTEDAAVAMTRRGVKAIRGQEASSFLVGTLEKYGLTVDDLAELKNLPEGYVLVKPRAESSGRIVLDPIKEGDVRAFALPEEFARAYQQYTDLLFHPEAQNRLLQFYDQLTRAYKTMAYMWNPGHIPRDWSSNVYNLWLMDVRSPIPYFKSSRVMMEKADKIGAEIYSFPQWEGTGKELYQMAEELGLTESSAVLAEFLQGGADWSFRLGGKYTDVMRKATRFVDNHARIAGVIDRLSKGDTPEEAVGMVKKYLFDYFDLTPTERQVMKRIIPFYTWMRKNIPLQLESLFTKPGKYATTYKASESIGDLPGPGEAPEFIGDDAGIRIGGEHGTYVLPNLSYADIGKVPLEMDTWRELSGSISPLIRGPFEMAGNVQLFSGQPIERYEGQRSKIPFGPAMEALGLVDQAPTIPTRTAGYLLNQIPPLRTLSTVANPEHPRQMARLMSVLGGPQIYPADWAKEAATYEERDSLRALVRSLQDRGRTVPTMAELTPKKEKTKKTTKKKGKYSYLTYGRKSN